jgi:hypothetical protein
MPVIATYRHRLVLLQGVGAHHFYVGRTSIHYWRYPDTPPEKVLSWITADLRDRSRRYVAPNTAAPPAVLSTTRGDYPAGSPYDFAE